MSCNATKYEKHAENRRMSSASRKTARSGPKARPGYKFVAQCICGSVQGAEVTQSVFACRNCKRRVLYHSKVRT